MTKEIKITVTSPCECTDEEFEVWVQYCLGYRGDISMSNPLHDYELEADDVTVF